MLTTVAGPCRCQAHKARGKRKRESFTVMTQRVHQSLLPSSRYTSQAYLISILSANNTLWLQAHGSLDLSHLLPHCIFFVLLLHHDPSRLSLSSVVSPSSSHVQPLSSSTSASSSSSSSLLYLKPGPHLYFFILVGSVCWREAHIRRLYCSNIYCSNICWAAWYNTWLLITLLKGLPFFLLLFLSSNICTPHSAGKPLLCLDSVLGLIMITPSAAACSC